MADDSQVGVPQGAAPGPAAPGMPPSWDKIAADPAFRAQPAEQRLKAKEAYFTQVIAPNIPSQTRTSLPDIGIHLEAYAPPYAEPGVDTQAVEDKNAIGAAHERLEKAYTSFMSYKPVQTGWGEFLTSYLPKDVEDFLPKLHASAKVANDAFNSSPGGAYQASLVQQYLEDPSKLTAETRAAVAPVAEKYKQRQQISDADLAPLRTIIERQARRQLLETPGQRLISSAVETAPDITAAAAGAYAGVPAPVTFSALQGLRSYADAKAKKLSDEDAIAHAGISTVVNGLTFPVAEATGGATGSVTGKVVGRGVSKVAGEKAGQAAGERAGAYVQMGTTVGGVNAATAGAQEIYDEYRAGKIDYKKLASVVGDEAAQGFVSGLAFGAGEHAAGTAARGSGAVIDAAGKKMAADSIWNEMGGAKKGGTTLDDLAPRPAPDTAAPAAGTEPPAKLPPPPATFNRGSRFEGAAGTPFEGISGTLVKAVDNPSGDRIWTVRAADGSLMQVPETQMAGYQKPIPFVHGVGDKVVIGGDHHAAGATGTVDDQIPTSQGPLYRIKTTDGQTLFAPEGQVHVVPRAALPAPGKPQEAAGAALPVTREGQAVTPEQQAEQTQLGLSEDVRGVQMAHPAYPRPAEPITPRTVDHLDGKRALIAAGPKLTADEHAVAANAEGVHPEDVPAGDVAALVAHYEADPAAAQKLVNANESDASLAAGARAAVEPAASGAPENRNAASGEPAQQPLGENGERGAGAPARAEDASKPGEPGGTEGQVGSEVRPPMPPPRAKVARPWINTDYNVPLGGGRDSPFRADGARKVANERTTYIGKNIPEWEWEPKSKRWINQWEEIDDHEIAEEKHLDELGYGGRGDAHDEHGNPATEHNIEAQGAKVEDYNKIVQPHLDKEREVAESGRAQLPPDLDRRVYEKREFAKLLANASPEAPAAAASKRLSPLQDPLLADEGSRRMLLGMADRAGWPEGKPGIAVRADRQSEVVGRATTQSAERWFKDAQSVGGLPRNTDGSATRAAVTKALAAEPMTAAERRHVGTMLDHIRQDQEMAEMAGVLKNHELHPADAGLVSLIARADDILGAQIVTELSDKHFGDDKAFRRALQEAIDEHRAPEEASGRGQGSGEPFALEAHTEADLRARKEQEELADQQRREAEARAAAPPPEGFTLTGSNRDADVGAAAGQRGLFEQAPEPASDGTPKKDGPKKPAFSRSDESLKPSGTASRTEPKSVKDLARKLSDMHGREIKVERVASPNDTARAMANVVRRLFGRNVEFVRSDDAGMSGAYIGDKTLYVNADAEGPHAQIIGHELLHSLRNEAPDTYYRLIDSLRSVVDRDSGGEFKNYLIDLYNKQGIHRLPPDRLHEELIAEIVGDHFSDPHFIRELQKNLEPNLFRRIAAYIQDFLEKVRAKLSGSAKNMGRQAQRFVQDIDAAREAVKTALTDLSERQRGSENAGQEAQPAFAREVQFSRSDTEPPETRNPEDRTAESPIGRARNFADSLLSATVKTFNPMATGSDRAQATAKDWANADRKARWRFQKLDEYAEKNFTLEQRQKMGEALDEMSVLTQSGAPTKGKGVDRLTPEERDYVERVNAMGAQVWQRAKDVGLVDGEGIPYYMPRSLVNVDDDGRVQRLGGTGEGGGRMPDRGAGMIKSSPNLRKRNYLLADDTEAAAKKKFGDGATLVTDIRALPLAMARLERAVAGRELINRIQDMGREAGVENVTNSADPGYFTLNHPAFETFRPKVIKNDETGKYEAATDQNGNTIFDRVPLYVSKEFEGPLRALMWAQPGELEKALMQTKAISAGTIMYSPFIHLGVEFGRAFPAMPGKIVTMKFWRDGNMAKNNYQTMSQAIDDGLVPIGKRGAYQDLTSIASDPVLDKDKPAQSLFGLLGKGIAKAVETFNPQAADKIRTAQHALGEFYHNTLLWDRIGDMQMGLYTNMKEAFMRKGLDEQTAGRVAAHEANRFAGTLPREAMSQLSTRIANLTLFSRQFTLGNLGVLKDSLTGLPGDVQAQIMRDSGPLMRKSAVSLARRKAIGTVLIDIGLMVAMNSLLQDYFKHRMGDDQLIDGYRRRLHDALNNASEHPTQLFNPFYFPERLSSTWDNEPGKQDRIMVGHEKDGTAIYMRLPFGKIGEEFKNWMESPIKTATSKESTILRPIIQTVTNDKGFGRHVYNPEPQGLGDVAKNIGNIAMTFISGMTPSDSIKSAVKLIDDSGKKVDGAKVVGPLVGLTFSSGAPGGPQVGELLQQEANQRSRMANELPVINELIDAGKSQEAMKKLESLGMSPKQAAIHIANREHKLVSRGRLKEFYQTATPEEIERYRRQMAASNELSAENQ